MNIQIRVLFSLLLVLFLYANPVLAGWVVTYAEAESSAQSKEYYQDGKANLGAMVFTGKHFLVVNPESKAYWKGTPQQYCESMGAQFKNMEEQMASLPAQYRPVPISQKKVTRKKIGTKSIAGFSATGYEFYFDGSQKGQVWVSSDSGLSEIIGFERSMSKDMRCFAQMDSASLQGAAIYKQTAENAFPLKESYREVLSVEREDVPASYF